MAYELFDEDIDGLVARDGVSGRVRHGVFRTFSFEPIVAPGYFGSARGYNEIGRSWSEMTLKQNRFLDRCMIAFILMCCCLLILSLFQRVMLP